MGRILQGGMMVRTAYLDCATGISGDMTLAALIDVGVPAEPIRQAVDSLGIPGVELNIDTIVKGGFRATKVDVRHPEQHAHRHLSDVRLLLDAARMTDRQRDLALQIFIAVATAEAHVHGSTVEQVHFHEVGAIDSIVDILGAAIGFDLLDAEQIVCSPLPPGRGSVHIDHGICPLPAPGTAELLKGIPLADVPVDAELTTPTGAAIVKVLVDRFASLPAMTIEQVGYGAGTMDFPGRANLLRLFVGDVAVPAGTDVVCLLETNLDDVSAEVLGYTLGRLRDAGALDAYTTAVHMKKDRPGVVLSVLAPPAEADVLEAIVFAETGTLGIRRQRIERSVCTRRSVEVQTAWGPVNGKVGTRGGTDVVFSPEFESCKTVAQSSQVPLREVYRAAVSAFAVTDCSSHLSKNRASSTKAHDHDHSQDVTHDHSHDGGHSHDHG